MHKPIIITFKRAYTSKIIKLLIDPNLSINKFLNFAKQEINRQTGIEFEKIIITQTGQTKKENADPLIESEKIFKFIFKNELPTFYFSIKTDSDLILTCPICLNDSDKNVRALCSHCYCYDCYNNLLLRNINYCPLCRLTTIV